MLIQSFKLFRHRPLLTCANTPITLSLFSTGTNRANQTVGSESQGDIYRRQRHSSSFEAFDHQSEGAKDEGEAREMVMAEDEGMIDLSTINKSQETLIA